MNVAFRAAVIGGIMFGCTPDDTEHRRADNSPSLIDQRSWAALGLAVQLDQFPQTKTTRIWTVQADETVLVCGEGTPRFVAKGTVPDPKGGSEFRLLTVENVWNRFCDNPPAVGLAVASSEYAKKDNPEWGSFGVMGSGFPRQNCAENGSCFGDISPRTNKPKTVHVPGYYRGNGTYVRGYYRSR